jgi:hypothetical protein
MSDDTWTDRDDFEQSRADHAELVEIATASGMLRRYQPVDYDVVMYDHGRGVLVTVNGVTEHFSADDAANFARSILDELEGWAVIEVPR